MPPVLAKSNRSLFWITTALATRLALAARFAPTPRTMDDAFITFRYARNWPAVFYLWVDFAALCLAGRHNPVRDLAVFTL